MVTNDEMVTVNSKNSYFLNDYFPTIDRVHEKTGSLKSTYLESK